MNSYLLDTNVLSELMRSNPDRTVFEWFESNKNSNFFISSVTEAEILTGIALLPESKKRLDLTAASEKLFSQDFFGRILFFDEKSAVIYAKTAADRIKSGHPISTEDAQIASIAISNELTLVTRNIKDFTGIQGLLIVNPWNPISYFPESG